VYAELLEQYQGVRPRNISIMLGDGRTLTFRYHDFAYYYATIKQRFEAYVTCSPATSQAAPCPACQLCTWRALYQAQ
jgi:predicted RecB family nuclease